MTWEFLATLPVRPAGKLFPYHEVDCRPARAGGGPGIAYEGSS